MALTEHTLDSEQLLEGGFLRVYRDRVRLPDGSEARREYIAHPGAVAVLPLTEAGELVLVRQYRYPVRQTFLEIPAGKIDAGEAWLATAQRELLEETGYTARRWHALPVAHPCIGYSDEKIAYFVADGLIAGDSQPDEGEFVEVEHLPLTEVIARAQRGELSDSKTLTGLFWLQAWQSGMLRSEPL